MVEGKKKFSCFMLVWDHVVCVFMNIFGLLLKTEITLYGTTLSFIMNLLPFCMSIILVWCVECLVVWRLCKRAITSVIKYKYNTNAIQLQCKNINITIHYNIPKWHNIEFFILFWSYEDVFLFLIYFSGGSFDIIIIDFHWKGLHFSFVVVTCLTWQKKKISQLFHACLKPLCLGINEHIWILIENWKL